MVKPNYLIIALLLLAFISNIKATTYYVDSKGGNDANSGRSSSAAWNSISKVNSYGFNSGDTVSFKCDCRFSGTTISAKSNITFNSYGSGAKPVIDGQSSRICFDLQNQNNVTFNGLRIVNGIPQCVNLWRCTYVTIESCNVDSSKGGDYHNSNLYTGYGSNLTVRNSSISYGYQASPTVDPYGNLGIYIDQTQNTLLEHDTLIGNRSNIRVGFGDGNPYDFTRGLIVRYCVVKNGVWDNIDDDGSYGAQFYYNVFESGVGSWFHVNIYLFSDGSGSHANYAPKYGTYVNNTFIQRGGNIIFSVSPDFVIQTQGMQFDNNIIYNANGSEYWEDITPWSSFSVYFNHNIYSTNGTWRLHNSALTFAQWQSAGYDSVSKCVDPMFTNYAAGDYSLQSGSPAINIGAFVGLSTDIKGTPVPAAYPDLGAYQHQISQSISANIKIFLEGPFLNGTMSTYLITHNMIPLSQPFNSSPWSYLGSESVAKIPSNIVDWILVELRSTTSGYAVVARRAAFLKNDGTIVDVDGSSALKFNNINYGNYYIVIKYINSIETWSKSGGVSFTTSTVSYDFTSAQSQAYGNNLVLKGTKWCVYSGDINQDGIVDSGDMLSIDNDNSKYTYHVVNDLNEDGVVDSSELMVAGNNNHNYIGKILPAGAN
jgi:hypothetical protein